MITKRGLRWLGDDPVVYRSALATYRHERATLRRALGYVALFVGVGAAVGAVIGCM